MFESWMRFALGEAVARTVSRSLCKLVGDLSRTVGDTFFATLIIGIVQMIGGLSLARLRHQPLLVDPKLIGWSILFGINAVLATVLGFVTFQYGGELGVSTFIVALSIIPGAFIDQIFFGHRLRRTQWLGVALGVFAGYAMLDFPTLEALKQLPLWVGLSAANMVIVAVNQGVTQAAKEIDPLVKNFWVGITTVVLAAAGALFTHGWHMSLSWRFWLLNLSIGVVVVVMISLNLLSYKGGGRIAIKKLITQGGYQMFAFGVGALLFHEEIHLGTAVGIAAYLAAFWIMRKG